MRDKPRSGDRHIAPTPAAYAAAENLSPPSGASGSCDAWYLGLTPQAIYLSRLRRSNQGVIPDPPSRSFFLGVSRGIAGGALITGYLPIEEKIRGENELGFSKKRGGGDVTASEIARKEKRK
jgi:hypothetical protein